MIQAEARTQNTLSLMLGSIAAISLLVGGIGVMNIMLMTVRERTREIGIRMATGARQRDILRQFLTEAVMLSVVGGLCRHRPGADGRRRAGAQRSGGAVFPDGGAGRIRLRPGHRRCIRLHAGPQSCPARPGHGLYQ